MFYLKFLHDMVSQKSQINFSETAIISKKYIYWTLKKNLPNLTVCENLPNSSCHLESKNQFSFKYCINIHCHQRWLLCTFLAQTLCTFKNISLKCKSLRNLPVPGSKFVKFLMSILYWQDNSFSNFASFFIVMTHNSTGNFKLIHFLLWIIVSHQGLNFEIFECSGKHLSNSSCHCWKHKSVFVQI